MKMQSCWAEHYLFSDYPMFPGASALFFVDGIYDVEKGVSLSCQLSLVIAFANPIQSSQTLITFC
jgi:hypothetical protein